MPTYDLERLRATIHAFIGAPSWTESRRIVENSPELLSDEADVLLAQLLEENQQNARVVHVLTAHRDLLRCCRDEGIEAAFADHADADPAEVWQKVLGQLDVVPETQALRQAVIALLAAPAPSDVLAAAQAHPDLLGDEAQGVLQRAIANAQQAGRDDLAQYIGVRYQVLQRLERVEVTHDPALVQALQAFLNASTWPESFRVVRTHPDLLTVETDLLITRLLRENQGDARAVRILTEHRDLLHRCRDAGVETAFVEKMNLPPGVSPQDAADLIDARAQGHKDAT